MPEIRANESLSQYVARCIPVVKAESKGKKYKAGHAYAKCRGMWEQAKKGKK